jgi:hypothetical protein
VDPFGVVGDGGADVGAGEGEGTVDLTGRAAAVRLGRLLGEAEARSRGEVGEARDGRVARAVRYAGWEFDTRAWRRKPLGTVAGVPAASSFRPDFKKGK